MLTPGCAHHRCTKKLYTSKPACSRLVQMTTASCGRWSKVRPFVKTKRAFCSIRIKFEDNKSTVNEKLSTIIKELGIQVSHKAGEAPADLSKQGNPMLYSEKHLKERASLRADPRVQKAIRDMWNAEVSALLVCKRVGK